jgi:ATP adenylyltransferase
LNYKSLWAPWRIGYIQGVADGTGECFLCHDAAHRENDEANLVLWRSGPSIVVLNRFPYNNGHLLVAPVRHIADLGEATDEELLDLVRQVRDMQKLLSLAISPHGFNVGINFGRCAGAGLPGHLHIHVVPRWNGDTSFVSVCTDTKIVSQSLAALMEQLKETARKHHMLREDPGLRTQNSEDGG